MRLHRPVILGLALLACVAWANPETDSDTGGDGTTAGEDTSANDCVDACKREDHQGCKQGCDASRWPSCAVAHPGL